MSERTGLADLVSGAVVSPFSRLRSVLEGVAPGVEPVIDLTLGEPREQMPAGLGREIETTQALFAKYPTIRGRDELRDAIAKWIELRFAPAKGIDAGSEILISNGSREGLFFACLAAVGRKVVAGRPVVAMCNPYYQAYLGAALAAGAEPLFLNASANGGHLPDLDALVADKATLARMSAVFLCSPANPQGAVADAAYLGRALELARENDFMLFVDECYSEIYREHAPTGGLSVAAGTAARFENLLVFNSLSKRSNLPGLRSGFCAGDAVFLGRLAEMRNLVGPTMPVPLQLASALAWGDEGHVAANRRAYNAKFDICDEVLGGRLGYKRPAGGFFLWLDVSQFGGSEHAALTIWKRSGVRVIPGVYLASADGDDVNPGAPYVRVALVQDAASIKSALKRIVSVVA